MSARQSIPYNNSKVLAERRLRRLRKSGSVELVILRPGIVFGPRSFWTGGLADELLSGTAYLVDGGRGVCNSLYVDNLVHAIRLASTTDGVEDHAFLLGERERITWAEFYLPLTEALGMRLAEIPVVGYRRPRLSRLRSSPAVRAVVSRVPKGLRRKVRRRASASSMEEPSMPRPKPAVTEEHALLHRCRYKLPYDKAQRMLGYEPSISFDEACRRSVGWLAFAGYPVVSRLATAAMEP